MLKKKNMRILIATGIFPPDIGGPATYTESVARALTERGITTHVLSYGKHVNPKSEFLISKQIQNSKSQIKIILVSRNFPKGIRHFWYFWKCFWLALKSDIVFSQDTISAGLPAMLAAKLVAKKFAVRVPGDFAWEQARQRFGVKDGIDDFQAKKYGFRVEFLRKIQKFVVNSADLVITPSKYFQKLVQGWVKDKDKVKAVYNGIDLKISKSKSVPTGHLPKGDKTIISAGRLVPWKGFDVLIEVMKDLPDWKLVIIGDGPEYKNLKFKIENFPPAVDLPKGEKLKDRVELAGSIPREEFLGYLQEADLFVLNTSFESFSFVIVEAMSMGLPVITTNICNLNEIIDDGENGILIEPNNKEQILKAVRRIEQDNNFRNRLSQNARTKAMEFSLDKTLDNLTDLFQKI